MEAGCQQGGYLTHRMGKDTTQSRLTTVKVEYTQILLTFSRPNWMAIYNRNGPVQHIIFTGGAAKEKQKQLCKT